MPGGRPLKFKTPEEMQEKIDEYFDKMEKPKIAIDGNPYYEPITITGLALALHTTRELLCNYEERDEFYDTIKRAKLRVENYAEKMLYLGKSAAGPIFALKNFNWSDKQQTEVSGPDGAPVALAVSVNFVKPDAS